MCGRHLKCTKTDRERERMRKTKRRRDGTATLSAAISDTYLNTYLPLQHGTASKYAEPALSTRVIVNETCNLQQQQQQQLQQQIAISTSCQRRRQATPERTFKPNERQKQKLFPLPLSKSVESDFRQAAKKFFLMKSSIYQIQYILGIYSGNWWNRNKLYNRRPDGGN